MGTAIDTAPAVEVGETSRTLIVDLTHARWRHFIWANVGFLLTALFVFAIGGAGILLLGVPCLIGALMATRSFLRTLMHEPGRISIGEDELLLPRALCSGERLNVAFSDLKHAYILRRSALWSSAGPLLVVEAQGRILAYPRDWFGSDSDQWHLFKVLNRRIRK